VRGADQAFYGRVFFAVLDPHREFYIGDRESLFQEDGAASRNAEIPALSPVSRKAIRRNRSLFTWSRREGLHLRRSVGARPSRTGLCSSIPALEEAPTTCTPGFGATYY